jgi:hypothetical protein
MYSFDFISFYQAVLVPYLSGDPKKLRSSEEGLFGKTFSNGALSWYAVSLAKLQRYQGPSFDNAPKDALIPIALELLSVVFSMVKQEETLPEDSLAYKVFHFKGAIPGLMLTEKQLSPAQRTKTLLILEGTTLKVNRYDSSITLIAGEPDSSVVIAENMDMPSMAQMYQTYLSVASS